MINRMLISRSWRVFTIAFLLGALGTLAFEPFSWFFMVFFSVGGLLWLLNNASTNSWKQAFAIGWWFGLGHFTTGLYWISFALGVDLKQFGWLIPFIVLGLPAILSFFIAPVTFFAKTLQVKGLEQALFFSITWAFFEWLRGHLFTGLPWNLIGYTWVPYETISQSLSFLGIYGLSFITIFIATLLYCTVTAESLKKSLSYFLFATLLLGSLWGGGKWRLLHVKEESIPDVYLRIVQPNISQKLKWNREYADKNFEHILALTNSPARKKITHILWPESAIPFFLEYDHERRQRLISIIPSQGYLMTGGIRLKKHSVSNVQIWNSIFVITAKGEIEEIYDKSHLVPFGEYVPMRSFFPSFIKKITVGSIDFSSGFGPRTLKITGLPPFSPLVCYEGIFPGEVKGREGERPEWIYNATNDAWYGPTSGPYQHLVINRARAIEEGLPYMRVANTGISAVIDAYGRIKASLPLDTEGVIDTELPMPSPSPTFYSLYGDRIFFGLLFFFSLLFFCSFFSQRRSIKNRN